MRHKIQPGDNDDFMVRTLEDIAAVRTEATRTMTALLASIAGVSLLVGGIGIMNIMLVSVTERTREIGLRLAIGARGRDVLLQFLVEAVVLSLLGGMIGIGLGYGLSRGLTQFLQWPTFVSPDAVASRSASPPARHLLRLLPGAEGVGPRPDRGAEISSRSTLVSVTPVNQQRGGTMKKTGIVRGGDGTGGDGRRVRAGQAGLLGHLGA